MKAILGLRMTAAGGFMPPPTLRARMPLRAGRLKRLLRAMLEGIGASPRDVPPEFYRFPFP